MAKNKDQFSGTDAEYDTFVNQIMAKCLSRATLWGIPTTGVLSVGSGLLAPWITYYGIAKTKTTASTEDRDNKDIARADLTVWMRKFVKKWIYLNDLMDDADVASTGLKPHSTTKTKNGKPGSVPVNVYSAGDAQTIKAGYRHKVGTEGATAKGKLPGSARIQYAIFVAVPLPADSQGIVVTPTAPLDPDDFGRFESRSKGPVELAFPAAQSGLMASLASRWITSTDINGDWCPIITFRIP